METKSLIIRKFMPDDFEDLYEYLSQEEVVEYEPYGVFTKEECKKEAIARSENTAFWAVCLKGSNKLIGNIWLEKQELETWELGYVFNSNYQGKGYASEAAFALVDDVFRNKKAYRVIAMCNPLNKSSWKLLERLNFRREGHLIKNNYFKKDKQGNPIWIDTFEYGILCDEWITLK